MSKIALTAKSEDRQTTDLRSLTDARVSLGRFGAGIPTRASQSFLLDHARARQAVWSEVNYVAMSAAFEALGHHTVRVESRAGDRGAYVRRPDLGRMLAAASAEKLTPLPGGIDIVIIVADGLSASAITVNAVAMVSALSRELASLGVTLGPIIMASQARVALGDPIGERLKAKVTIMLIGERPGLSAADSMGAYITYAPRSGTPDSRRNCISNIRENGLPIDAAANLATQLVSSMIKTGVSGVALKDATGLLPSP